MNQPPENLASAVPAYTGSIGPLAVLLRLLDHENEAHRFYAARAIGAIAPTIVDQADLQMMLDALAMHREDPDPDVRHESVVAMRVCTKPLTSDRYVAQLIDSLTGDPEIDVKCEVIALLAEWHCNEALPIIRQIAAFDLAEDDLMIQTPADVIEITWDEIEGDIDDRLRAQKAAISALRNLGNADDAQMLTSLALSDAAEDVGSLVCAVLAQLGDAGIASLVELSQRARSRVRRDAVSELGNCADTVQLLTLRKLYSDSDPEFRAALISSIGKRVPDDSLLEIACRDTSSKVRSCAASYVKNNAQLIKSLLADPEASVRLSALGALVLSDANHIQLARTVDRLASDTDDSVIGAVPPALIAVTGIEARRSLHRWISTSRFPARLRVSALRSLVKLEKGLDLSGQPSEWKNTQVLARSMLTDDARDMRLCAVAVLADEANDGNTVAANYLAEVLSESIHRLVVLRDNKARCADAIPVEKADSKTRETEEESDAEVTPAVSEQVISLSTLESILNANDEARYNNSETDDWKDNLDEHDRLLLGSTSHWPKAKHISLTPDISLDLDIARSITRASAEILNPNLLAALVEALEYPDTDLNEAAIYSLSHTWPSAAGWSDTTLSLRVIDICKSLLNENRNNMAIAAIALLGEFSANETDKILLDLLDDADPWRQLATLRALSENPNNIEVIRDKAVQFLDYEFVGLRHSAIQILGKNNDKESIHMLLDRLGAHAGADASVIGKTLTVTGSATVEEGLCQLLCDNARQREWRFATETLAACILASGRQ